MVLLTAMIFYYPNVSQTVLSIFACYPVGGQKWWAYQMDQRCFQGQHTILAFSVGIVFLLVGVVLPPAWMLLKVCTHQGHRTRRGKPRAKYLFLYHSYKDQYYWWECLKMTYILGLVCVRVLGLTM